MEAVTELFQINYAALLVSVICVVAGWKAIATLFDWLVDRLGLETKWMRNKREDHELLVKTSQNLDALQTKSAEDVKESIQHDQMIKDDIGEMREEIKDMRSSLDETQERLEELNTDGHNRDKQIGNLTIGMMELLGDKIDQRFSRYVSLGGIPEDEVDEFIGIYKAYEATGGNHKRKDKYEYVMAHMKVIPVEYRLLLDEPSESAKEEVSQNGQKDRETA